MTILAVMDDSPVLVRYWEPADGGVVPPDLGAAVLSYLHEMRGHLMPTMITQTHDDEYRVVAVDFRSDKIRDIRLGLREARL